MPWTTDLPAKDLLGVGLYAPAEAATYIGVRPQQLVRWVYGSTRGEAVVEPQFPGHREVISFLDMVQAMAIRDMRRKEGIPLLRIRQAIGWLQEHHPEIRYPFARRHENYIMEPQRQIAICLPGMSPADYVLQVSGRHAGQWVLAKVLDKYLQNLEFDKGEPVVARFVPLQRKAARVVLDPEVRFGQPRVEPSGYLVEALAEAADAEGSAEAAAWWYDIDPRQVAIALEYRNGLRGRHAKAS